MKTQNLGILAVVRFYWFHQPVQSMLMACLATISSHLMPGGCINSTHCQWWSRLFWIGQLVWEEDGSLSKTTKLLLLDSLLQEVCIESGSDGSLALSSLGLSVCLVSHNLLYSGLKKAHLKMKTKSRDKVHFIIVPWIIALKLCWWSKASWEQKLYDKENPFSQAHNKSRSWFQVVFNLGRKGKRPSVCVIICAM